MKRMILIALGMPGLALAAAGHQPRHAGPPAACRGLKSSMDDFGKTLAMNYAAGIGDDSAPRATMREAEYNTVISRMRLTMDLMRDNHCPMPAAVPTGAEYVDQALACRNDQIKAGGYPDSCVQSNWVTKTR